MAWGRIPAIPTKIPSQNRACGSASKTPSSSLTISRSQEGQGASRRSLGQEEIQDRDQDRERQGAGDRADRSSRRCAHLVHHHHRPHRPRSGHRTGHRHDGQVAGQYLDLPLAPDRDAGPFGGHVGDRNDAQALLLGHGDGAVRTLRLQSALLGFGVPFIMGGAWYLVRTWRLNQSLKLAKGDDSIPKSRKANFTRPSPRPRPNKRYTPPTN